MKVTVEIKAVLYREPLVVENVFEIKVNGDELVVESNDGYSLVQRRLRLQGIESPMSLTIEDEE